MGVPPAAPLEIQGLEETVAARIRGSGYSGDRRSVAAPCSPAHRVARLERQYANSRARPRIRAYPAQGPAGLGVRPLGEVRPVVSPADLVGRKEDLSSRRARVRCRGTGTDPRSGWVLANPPGICGGRQPLRPSRRVSWFGHGREIRNGPAYRSGLRAFKRRSAQAGSAWSSARTHGRACDVPGSYYWPG